MKMSAEQLSLLIEIDNATEWDGGGGDRPGRQLTRVYARPLEMPRGVNKATLRRFEREGLIRSTNSTVEGFYAITEDGIVEANR